MEKLPKPLIYNEALTPGRERNVEDVMNHIKHDIGIILEKMRPSIEKHEYGIILGIDGGGRVPALVVGDTLNRIYHSKNQEKIKTFFVAGSRNLHTYKEGHTKREDLRVLFLGDSFQHIKTKKEKVLILEDVVSSGESLDLITKTMLQLGIQFEIATLSFDDSKIINPTYVLEDDIIQIEEKLGSKIIYGEYGAITPLYGAKQMSGVHKESDVIFSKPIGKPVTGSSKRDLKIPESGNSTELVANRDVLVYTRELIPKISSELFEKYIKF